MTDTSFVGRAEQYLREQRDRKIDEATNQANAWFDRRSEALLEFVADGWQLIPPEGDSGDGRDTEPTAEAEPAAEEDPSPAPVDKVEGSPAGESRPSLREAIMGVLEDLPEVFTVRDAQSQINTRWPEMVSTADRPKLSAALNTVRQGGFLQLVKSGKGRRPSTYRRPSNETSLVPDGDESPERVVCPGEGA